MIQWSDENIIYIYINDVVICYTDSTDSMN